MRSRRDATPDQTEHREVTMNTTPRNYFLALLPLLAAVQAGHAQSAYTLTDLGWFQPSAFNTSDEVVGYDVSGSNDGAIVDISGGVVDVRSFAGVSGVNDAGLAVGSAQSGSDIETLLIAADGTQTLLNPFNTPSPANSAASAVNASGVLTGYYYLQQQGPVHAFVYDTNSGIATDLGTLGGDYSVGNAINSKGAVAGYSINAAGQGHAALFYGGNAIDLGTVPGSWYSRALGINDLGQVTGYSMFLDGTQHTFFYDGASMIDIGAAGGTVSQGNAINNAGQIVGSIYSPPPGNSYPYLYSGGSFVDLNTLIQSSPLASHVTLSDAVAINNKGWILAYGENTQLNQAHAFLLTPQPVLPTAPGGLLAVPGNGQVQLSWSGSSDPGGASVTYAVFEGTSPGGENIRTWTGAATSATIAGLSNGTAYYFVVKAESIGGETAPSNEVSAKPEAGPPPAVSLAVKPLTITVGASATLSWSSKNATSCSASGAWSGKLALRGSKKVTPTAKGSYSYTLTCSGIGGSASKSATLRVR
jgi:probable HAF family extracellular repeat protein